MAVIAVEPLPVGWRIKAPAGISDLYFLSRRAAERSARRLALRLAEQGDTVELQVYVRDGALASKFVCLPPRPGDASPLMVETPPIRSRPAPA